MIQFGRRLNATEAMHWGLIAEVVPEGGSMGRALEIARWAGGMSRSTLSRAKAMVTFSYSAPTATARYITALADAIQLSSAEFQAGIAGFAEREKPKSHASSSDEGGED
jgi:enoyl-CoA hydratase/carnithine racemase